MLADAQRLNQILLNLLSNAVKYNREGGTVRIGFDAADDARVRLTVTDTGEGIAPAKLALLFQPFERLGAERSGVEGTGLGLAISRGLAEAMGGAVGVRSEVGRGSTFWVELAITDALSTSKVEDTSRLVAPIGSPDTRGVVLYIEDDPSNVRLMSRVLERRPGVRLCHAPDGQSGLAAAAKQRPDLIFLDLHLPSVSGEEVLRRIRQDVTLKDIPIIVLTADATADQARRLRGAGAFEYMTKPLEIGEVLRLVDDRLRASDRDAEIQ